MNMKRRLASFVAFLIVLICLSAYPAAGLADGEESMMSQVNAEKTVVAFDFESKTVLMNSGYTMPIMGLGTYALDHDTCVNSVMSLLESGGRLIDTAYMYGNEEAVGEGVRKGMEEYGIPREDIFVITKIYPNQFNDPEAAIDMALEKLDIGYIDMMLLHHPGTNDVMAYQAMEQYVEEGKIHSLGLSNWYVEELTDFLPQVTIKPALVQNEIHPYYQEQDVVPFIQEKGIVVQWLVSVGGTRLYCRSAGERNDQSHCGSPRSISRAGHPSLGSAAQHRRDPRFEQC